MLHMCSCLFCFLFFFFKQKTAYEMRISYWSSDVCSSDLGKLSTGWSERVEGTGRPYVRVSFRQADCGACPARILCTRNPRQARSLRQIGRASCREGVCQYV